MIPFKVEFITIVVTESGKRGTAMLKEVLIESTEYFTKKVLAKEVTLYESCSLEPAYASSIQIHGDENYDITVFVREKSLKTMAFLFLYDDAPTEEVLQDLMNEIANIVVGRAKVTAAEKYQVKFDISTPDYRGNDQRPGENDFEITFLFEEELMTITGKGK